MWNLKLNTKDPVYETGTDSGIQGVDWLPRRGAVVGGGMEWEAGISRCTSPLYSTENYIQNPVINHNGKEYFFLEKNAYLCIELNHCCAPEVNATL